MEKRIAELEKKCFKKGWFQKGINDKEELLMHVFFIFAFYDEDLPAKLVNYVLHGDKTDAMQNLNFLQALKAVPTEKFPVNLRNVELHGYSPQSKMEKKEQQLLKGKLFRSYEARDKIFNEWADCLTKAELLRYGKALAVLPDQFLTQDTTDTAIPLWLITLLHHCEYNYQGYVDMDFKEKRPLMTLDSLADLLAEDGLNRHIVYDLLCDSKMTDSGYQLPYVSQLCYKLVGFEATLIQNIDGMVARFKRFTTSDAQFAQIRLIKQFPALMPYMEDFIIELSLSVSKSVAKEAFPFLSQLDVEKVINTLNYYLCEGLTAERGKSAELLAFFDKAEPLLQSALATEKTASVRKKIESSLSNLKSIKTSAQKDHLDIPLFVPEAVQKLVATEVFSIFQENLASLLATTKIKADAEALENKAHQGDKSFYASQWQQDKYKYLCEVTTEDLELIAQFVNGDCALDNDFLKAMPNFMNQSSGLVEEICLYHERIYSFENFSLYHFVRILYLASAKSRFLNAPKQYLQMDLRQICYELTQSVIVPKPKRCIAKEYLISYNYSSLMSIIPNELVWPFFAENLEFIHEGLGLVPSKDSYWSFNLEKTLEIIELFPSIPASLLPHLLEIALGDAKTTRPIAQRILSKVTDIHLRVEEALSSGKQDIRRTAIEWLVTLQQPSALKALYALLKREKNEMVRATLLTALESLGEDIASYLSPEVLLKEAGKGLSGKIPVSFTWFDRNVLPICQWQNGDKVNPDIIYYWVVLAVKLKLPEGNGLFQRYLSLLDQKSQQSLGQVLLNVFIAQDTIAPSEEEALAVAKRGAPQRLKDYQYLAKEYPNEAWAEPYRNATIESVTVDLKREALAKYLGSAIKDKGMLAFIHGMEPQLAVTMVTRFMKDHYRRRAQVEAILTALSVSEHPHIIQLILSVSRRHRTASVQVLAKSLVEAIGERNGWTKDELADRTIPTAGIEDDGILRLDYGQRVFIAKLNDKRSFVLFSPEGKEIKALPDGRKDEDAELVKETKKQFFSSKKELKQIITLQLERLFEAMCAKRLWSVQDWQTYLVAHPIMKYLIQQLVWLNVKEDETIIHSFRPTEDGAFITVEDDEITLDDGSFVMLAHSALLNAPLVKAWKAHLMDYKVISLFPQFENGMPTIEKFEKNEILDRQGWITDTFTFRNIMKKLGYIRGSAEDGGFFSYYSKPFESMNCHSVISFSGNHLPEENITAVLFGLSFQSSLSWNAGLLTVDEIPPILLAEGYGDYLKVAKACSGFDPEWQKKSPF